MTEELIKKGLSEDKGDWRAKTKREKALDALDTVFPKKESK